MYLFKSIVFNCKRATLLALKKEDKKLSFLESLTLRYHLWYCRPCREFVKHSSRINQAGKQVAADLATHPPFRLTEEKKMQMQRELNQLNK